MTSHDEPALPTKRIAPRDEHDPDDTAYDTAPVPNPPEVVMPNAIPKIAETELITNGA
jgi:hypothetical protein